MRKFYLIIFFLSSFAITGFSQTDILAGSSFYFGIPMNGFTQNRNVLGSRMSYNFGTDFSVQLRMFGRFSIEGGIMQNVHNWRMKDKNFSQRHPGYEVEIKSKNHYYSWFAALQYAQPIGDETFWYFESGYGFHNTGGGTLTETKNFVMENEDVTISTTYTPRSTSMYFGTGIQKITDERHMFFAGIRLNRGRDIMTTGTYTTVHEGTTMSSDGFTGKGSYLAVQAGYRFIIFHKEKKIREPKQPKPKKEKPQKEPKGELAIAKPVLDTLDTKVEGRQLAVENKISVNSRTVTIRVWDDQKVDGDQISLNLNGNWILQDYTLEKKAYEITAELQEGENVLVLHALNLGKISPNTAALVVDDGIEQQKMVLESTLTTSGTLIIQFNP